MLDCVQALLFCKSNGMNLASIETDAELKNLNLIARRNRQIVFDEIFVDSESGLQCNTLKKSSTGRFAVSYSRFMEKESKFMCEHVEESETFEAAQKQPESVNVKATFFISLTNEVSDVNFKKYYLSRNYFTPGKALMACKSFGMTLASPTNQMEYNKLQAAASLHPKNPTIALYKSADKKTWLGGNGKEINYKIDWNIGEPNNCENNEECVMFTNSVSGLKLMNDVPCNTARYSFICEHDTKAEDETKLVYDAKEAAKYFETIQLSTATLSVSKASMKLSFFDAKLMCSKF